MGGGGCTLRRKFYYMVVNRNELLIMCIPRFPKLKIHFNSDFLHYKELYNKVELNRAHPFKCFGSIKVSTSKNNAALFFVVSCEKGEKN